MSARPPLSRPPAPGGVRLRSDVRTRVAVAPGRADDWKGDVSVRALTVRYGSQLALDGVDFDVASGSCVAVLGGNGAGKTTLLRSLSGSLRPIEGAVHMGAMHVERWLDHEIARLGVCHVPEGRGIFPGLTVEDNLRLLVEHSARDEVFARFPVLAERRRQLAGSLSGGEQQMLALARALGGSPRLLLVDELSLGLAPVVVHDLYETLASVRSQGLSLVIVEQFADRALAFADWVYVLRKGRVVFSGAAHELAARGPDHLRALYLGADNLGASSSGRPR